MRRRVADGLEPLAVIPVVALVLRPALPLPLDLDRWRPGAGGLGLAEAAPVRDLALVAVVAGPLAVALRPSASLSQNGNLARCSRSSYLLLATLALGARGPVGAALLRHLVVAHALVTHCRSGDVEKPLE